MVKKREVYRQHICESIEEEPQHHQCETNTVVLAKENGVKN